MRPMPVFQSAEELKSHYRALKARLGGLPLPPKPVERAPPEELEETKTLIQILLRQPSPWPTNYRRIQDIVCRRYGLEREEFLGQARETKFVYARWVGMYLCRHMLSHSLERIGKEFGNRDHTTVLNGLRKIAARIANDPEFAAEIEELRQTIRGISGKPIEA